MSMGTRPTPVAAGPVQLVENCVDGVSGDTSSSVRAARCLGTVGGVSGDAVESAFSGTNKRSHTHKKATVSVLTGAEIACEARGVF